MSYPVALFIYDLSQGMARSLGPALGLHDLEGVWHTSIVVHNTEIFFGGSGIEHCLPGGTMLGQPLQQKSLGNTNMDFQTLTDYLKNVGQAEFHGSRYDLFNHNCNNFSSSLTKYLGVQDIPQHILDLPRKVMASPIAAMLRPIIEGAVPDGQGTSFGGPENSSMPNGSVSAAGPSKSSSHFPPKEYLNIKTPIDIEKVMGRLLEFNAKNANLHCITDENLTMLRLLSEDGVKINEEILDRILTPILIHWPKDDTFAILHIISANISQEGITKEQTLKMYSLMKQYKLISSDSPQSRMCYRILVNSFSAEVSRSAMMDIREELISIMNTLLEDSEDEISPQVENAITCLVLNYAKAIRDSNVSDTDQNEAAFQIVSTLSTAFLNRIKGPEALYKIIVALSTLILVHQEVKDLAIALDIEKALKNIPKGRMSRLDEIVAESLVLL